MTRKTAPATTQPTKPPVAIKAATPRAKASAEPAVKPHAKPVNAPSPRPAGKRASRTAHAPAPGATAAAPARDSKQARLIASLRAEPGITIAQMMALTGWQAHTVRGTLSGVLRKKLGLNVTSSVAADGGERRYRIVGSAAQA